VATEARKIGVGEISQVAREAGVTRKTIRKGIQELETGACYLPGERLRKPGGGRKNVTEKDMTLETDLKAMLEPKGDPQSLVKWTSKSVSQLRRALSSQGYTIGETAIRRMLHARGFSLKANKKRIEGISHTDRDAQFQHINRTGKAFQANQIPSHVTCKGLDMKILVSQRNYDQASCKKPWQKSAMHCLECLEIVQWISIKNGVLWSER
jgi:transposase